MRFRCGCEDGAGRLDGRDVGDGRRLRRPVGDAEGRVGVGRVLADGAYDSRANFNFPAGEEIKPFIRVGEGAAPRRGVGGALRGSRPS